MEGASFTAVSDLLAEHHLTTNRFYFRLLGRWTEKDQMIKRGRYTFHTAMRPIDILDELVRGRVVQKEVIIREGLNAKQIGRILEEAGLLIEEEFAEAIRDPVLLSELEISADSLEGYLFPDTYLFPEEAPVQEIIKQMVNRFHVSFDAALQARADQLGITRQEAVTLASIIDKETMAAFERPIISAVFHNRLKIGMRLQSDPTVIYGITDFNGDLTRTDLQTFTPYNTYVIAGLPPGPIANPGQAALEAAVSPADVDYLYFVSKNNGTHYFSKTLREHNAAVNQYQRRHSAESQEES